MSENFPGWSGRKQSLLLIMKKLFSFDSELEVVDKKPLHWPFKSPKHQKRVMADMKTTDDKEES